MSPTGNRARRLVLPILGLAAYAALRLIALPEPIGVDQGIFAIDGWGLLRGLMLYRDTWDQKPPGIHLTYAAGFFLFGPHARTILLLDILASIGALICLFQVASRLGSPAGAWATALTFAVGTYPALAHDYGGFLARAVPESFIVTLVAAAAWVFTARERPGAGRAAAAGVLIGVAAIFKPTALIYWPALLAFAWSRLRRFPARESVVSAALLPVPAMAVAVWLWYGHALADAWIAVVEYNRAYIAVGGWAVLADRLAHELWRLVKTDPLWLLAAVSGATALGVMVRRRRLEPLPVLALVWLAAAVVAVAANGVRMYATYFLPAASPLALLVGWAAVQAATSRAGSLLAAAALLVAGAAAIRSHVPDRAWRIISADVAQLRHRAPRLTYLEQFGGYANGRGFSARANEELAEYLAARTRPGDRLYIYGMAPSVYFMAGRLPANRFVWTFPGVAPLVRRPGFSTAALARDLESAAPAYVVLERHNRDSASGWRIEDEYEAPAMQPFLAHYAEETRIEDFTVLRRREK